MTQFGSSSDELPSLLPASGALPACPQPRWLRMYDVHTQRPLSCASPEGVGHESPAGTGVPQRLQDNLMPFAVARGVAIGM